jgi:hypothetical protein
MKSKCDYRQQQCGFMATALRLRIGKTAVFIGELPLFFLAQAGTSLAANYNDCKKQDG